MPNVWNFNCEAENSPLSKKSKVQKIQKVRQKTPTFRSICNSVCDERMVASDFQKERAQGKIEPTVSKLVYTSCFETLSSILPRALNTRAKIRIY